MAAITVRGACLHNFKNVTLAIPKQRLVVFSGVSGSGKSTLALETLHKEGMRQYMESLGMVSYAVSKPPLDAISGLSPSVSVDQGLTNHSPRSTVGTATDVYTYLRILFARVGHRPCPRCGGDVPPLHGKATVAWEKTSTNCRKNSRGLWGKWLPCQRQTSRQRQEGRHRQPDADKTSKKASGCPARTAGRACPRCSWACSPSTSRPAPAPPAPAWARSTRPT